MLIKHLCVPGPEDLLPRQKVGGAVSGVQRPVISAGLGPTEGITPFNFNLSERNVIAVKMYQSLALSSNQSPYSHDSGNYIHTPANSPVYVPTTRVPSMLPTLPYLQPCDSPHQSHGLGGHHGWPQGATDGSTFTPSSPHPPHSFYSHSPPVSSNTGRDPSYQSPLVFGNGARADQYGGALVRSVGGSYSSPYAYMSPEMATSSWTPGPFESGVISLHGGLSGKRSSLGKQGPNFLFSDHCGTDLRSCREVLPF